MAGEDGEGMPVYMQSLVVNCYYSRRMYPYTYRIRFLFVHPTLDFTPVKGELSKIPGINSSQVRTYGQESRTPVRD